MRKERVCALCGKTLRPGESGREVHAKQLVVKAPTPSGRYSISLSAEVEGDEAACLCELCLAASAGVIAGRLCHEIMGEEEEGGHA